MDLVVLLARLLLAGVFVISAATKLLDRSGSRAAVQDFGVPASLVPVVAAGLPAAELICATLLVTEDPTATLGAVASALLLGAFTVAIVVNLVRGRRPDCHCFGQLSASPTGWPTVARNGCLLVLATLPLSQAGDLPSVPGQLASYSTGELALATVLAGLAVAVLVLGTLFGSLLRRYGDVLLRLEALESAGTAAGTPRPAPHFELADLDGVVVRLADVLSEQRPILLVFVSPSCLNCSELLPDLESWQSGDHPLSVVVLSIGTAEENRAKLGAAPTLQILLQAQHEVATSYGSHGTPGAFLIGVDGLIATPGTYGADAIRQLHDSVITAMNPSPAPPHQEVIRAEVPALAIGEPLPRLLVQTEAGQSIELVEVAGDETVLLFWDSGCGFCSRILADVAALESETPILIISPSPPAAIRESGLTSILIRDPSFSVGKALGVRGTPSAVLVRDASIASEVSIGGPDVLELLARRWRYAHDQRQVLNAK
ncbi:MAG: redoxin domain-containing protein [Actinomycetota bacterium]|nr:redoxin domain-containing protein [Actinomycetota bacterium]